MAEEQTNEQPEQSGGKQKSAAGGGSPAAAKTRKILTMAEGKATTSLKGIMAHGDELKPEHFNGGQKKLDALKQSGAAVEIEVQVK